MAISLRFCLVAIFDWLDENSYENQDLTVTVAATIYHLWKNCKCKAYSKATFSLLHYYDLMIMPSSPPQGSCWDHPGSLNPSSPTPLYFDGSLSSSKTGLR
ncbi:hypothetical protein HPP92_005552 [Vanilla planifolia]|uniref:Uncharacterized protein n=1 Tax=Vanilla planifolia TaxID=51239 RepID=A0A835RIT7_VANPL|nr:hypothetical protein HPP92_005552 [Vanilla planifolia]